MSFSAIIDLLFPKCCFGCGREGYFACADCLSNLKFLKDQLCPVSRKKNRGGRFLNSEFGRDFYFDQLIVCMNYKKNELLRKMVYGFKYKFSKELCSVLANILKTQFIYLAQEDRDLWHLLVVPVPIHKKRLKFRGFNQAKVLADKFVELVAGLKSVDCLERTDFHKEQAKLNRKERLKNLKGAIQIKIGFEKEIVGKRILLIDDIATTCSTLNECAKVLKENGATYVCGLVLARG